MDISHIAEFHQQSFLVWFHLAFLYPFLVIFPTVEKGTLISLLLVWKLMVLCNLFF